VEKEKAENAAIEDLIEQTMRESRERLGIAGQASYI
jgi:hypothetical protein